MRAAFQHSVVIGETVFAQGRDFIQLALLDLGALGIEMRLSMNRKFYFGQRFHEPSEAAQAVIDRRREYTADGWTVQDRSDPLTARTPTAPVPLSPASRLLH